MIVLKLCKAGELQEFSTFQSSLTRVVTRIVQPWSTVFWPQRDCKNGYLLLQPWIFEALDLSAWKGCERLATEEAMMWELGSWISTCVEVFSWLHGTLCCFWWPAVSPPWEIPWFRVGGLGWGGGDDNVPVSCTYGGCCYATCTVLACAHMLGDTLGKTKPNSGKEPTAENSGNEEWFQNTFHWTCSQFAIVLRTFLVFSNEEMHKSWYKNLEKAR